MAATVTCSALPELAQFHKHLSDTSPKQQPKTLNPLCAILKSLQSTTSGCLPTKSTYISTIKSCTSIAAISEGESVHAHIIKAGLASDRFVASSIIGFYSSCSLLSHARQVFEGITDKDVPLQTAMLSCYWENGEIGTARKLFDEMNERDAVAWNAMISGYTQCGLPEEALDLFREMQTSVVRPNEVTMISVLSACSQTGSLALGEWMHAYINRHLDGGENMKLNNALVHMYAKCGRLDSAFKVFLEKEPKNLESWNTMLTSFAIHGCGTTALSLFSQMIKLGLLLDYICFLGLLMACSHAGLVDHAVSCFNFMTRSYGIEPKAEHYGCLVDVLSRRGYLDEARMVVKCMPFKPNVGAWGALLNGCLTHCKYELGLKAATHLLELEPWEEGRYIALMNLYAMLGRVQDSMNVRKAMAKMGIKLSSGQSTIEVDGISHEFLPGDTWHCQSNDVYSMIEVISSTLEVIM